MSARIHKKRKGSELSGFEALCVAHQITCYPFVFQAVVCLDRFGFFKVLDEAEDGLTLGEFCSRLELNDYAVRVLLEVASRFHILLKEGNKYKLSKIAYFLLHDEMVRVNLNFAEDVCYRGLFALPESLKLERPVGLKKLGPWSDVYRGLKFLPPDIQKSWFDFDHFYSDQSTHEAIKILCRRNPKRICDIGGNTGKFEIACCKALENTLITVLDLPEQCEIINRNVAEAGFADRVVTVPFDLLSSLPFPEINADSWWISQVLDCFSEAQVKMILNGISKKLGAEDRLYILEPLIGNQPFETGDQCLSAFSLYFSAIATGKSRFFSKDDILNLITDSGLEAEEIIDGLGTGHSLIVCKKNKK